jgi:hypothetical protein
MNTNNKRVNTPSKTTKPNRNLPNIQAQQQNEISRFSKPNENTENYSYIYQNELFQDFEAIPEN